MKLADPFYYLVLIEDTQENDLFPKHPSRPQFGKFAPNS